MTGPVFGSFVYSSNAPEGVVCGRIGNFILVSLASDEYTVQWNSINSLTDWPTPNTDDARAKQAGAESLVAEYGKVTGISGGEFFGYVFQQKAITKFTYVGGDVVFRVETIDSTRGCIDYNRFAKVRDSVFFESETGRHVLTAGQVQDIGLAKTDDSYKPVATLSADQKNVVANPAIDTVFFEGQNIAYNYNTGEWTRNSALSGKVYYPVDTEAKVVGQITFSGNDVDIQDSEGGAPTTAKITTSEFDPNPGSRALITDVKPLVDGGTWTVRVGARSDLSEAVSWSASASINARTGWANMRKEGRYLRAEFTCADGFNTAMGAEVMFAGSGRI